MEANLKEELEEGVVAMAVTIVPTVAAMDLLQSSMRVDMVVDIMEVMHLID